VKEVDGALGERLDILAGYSHLNSEDISKKASVVAIVFQIVYHMLRLLEAGVGECCQSFSPVLYIELELAPLEISHCCTIEILVQIDLRDES
jgi:hypothetical protein